jgi:hypothetical protein
LEEKNEELAKQKGGIWTHYKTLFNTVQNDRNAEQLQIHEKLNGLEKAIKDNQNPLDSPITDQELYKTLKFKKHADMMA